MGLNDPERQRPPDWEERVDALMDWVERGDPEAVRKGRDLTPEQRQRVLKALEEIDRRIEQLEVGKVAAAAASNGHAPEAWSRGIL